MLSVLLTMQAERKASDLTCELEHAIGNQVPVTQDFVPLAKIRTDWCEESSRCLLVSKRVSAGQLNRREYLGGESHLFQGGLGSRGAKSPPPKEIWERKKHADQARCDPPCVNGCSVAIASVMC